MACSGLLAADGYFSWDQCNRFLEGLTFFRSWRIQMIYDIWRIQCVMYPKLRRSALISLKRVNYHEYSVKGGSWLISSTQDHHWSTLLQVQVSWIPICFKCMWFHCLLSYSLRRWSWNWSVNWAGARCHERLWWYRCHWGAWGCQSRLGLYHSVTIDLIFQEKRKCCCILSRRRPSWSPFDKGDLLISSKGQGDWNLLQVEIANHSNEVMTIFVYRILGVLNSSNEVVNFSNFKFLSQKKIL